MFREVQVLWTFRAKRFNQQRIAEPRLSLDFRHPRSAAGYNFENGCEQRTHGRNAAIN